MKRKYYDLIAQKAYGVAVRAEGIAYLLEGFVSQGTSDRDGQKRAGIAMILEDIARASYEVSEMIEERKPLDFEIEINKQDRP